MSPCPRRVQGVLVVAPRGRLEDDWDAAREDREVKVRARQRVAGRLETERRVSRLIKQALPLHVAAVHALGAHHKAGGLLTATLGHDCARLPQLVPQRVARGDGRRVPPVGQPKQQHADGPHSLPIVPVARPGEVDGVLKTRRVRKCDQQRPGVLRRRVCQHVGLEVL